MDALPHLYSKVIAPFFYPFLPSQRIYWLYLAAAFVLVLVAYAVRCIRAGEPRPTGFLVYCFPRSVFGHRSAIVDYKYFIINKIAFGIFFAPFVLGSAATSQGAFALLGIGTGEPAGLQLSAEGLAAVLFTLATVVALDAGIFVNHYLQHKIPALWEFHKVHHSAAVLTPITVYRTHPVDDLFAGSVTGMFVGLAHGALTFLYGEGLGEIQILELNAVLFVFYIAGYNLRHSHVWLPYPRLVSHVFISPAQHQIHHSSEPRHFDRNFGFMFAFWDWLAGTLYVPSGHERFKLGLFGGEHRDYDSVWRLYAVPIVKLAARLRGHAKRRA